MYDFLVLQATKNYSFTLFNMPHISYFKKSDPKKVFHLEFDDDLDPVLMAWCTYMMQNCREDVAGQMFFWLLSEAAHWFPSKDYIIKNFKKDCIVENYDDYEKVLQWKTIADLLS